MSTKILNGKELAGFIKERQARVVAGKAQPPKLLIIKNGDNPVIDKYVQLKIRYGEDIGVPVEVCEAASAEEIRARIKAGNADPEISGIIIQLPISNQAATEELCNLIAPEKDVDGLGQQAKYDSATATAILWLLAGYDIKLENQKIAIVGRGKLVGAPLYRIFKNSGRDVTMFHRGDDLAKLRDYQIIVSAASQG